MNAIQPGPAMTPAIRRGLVVVAHPDPASFNHALAHAVAASWAAAGIVVKVRDLHAERFDPVLTLDEQRGRPATDPLVRDHIADVQSSRLLAIVHPNCWGAPPAIMKGWIDRVFAQDAAYAFEKGSGGGDVPIGLLAIERALVLNTGNTPVAREQEVFGDPLDRIWRQCVLHYCGVTQVERELFAVVADSTRQQRQIWLSRAAELANSMLQ